MKRTKQSLPPKVTGRKPRAPIFTACYPGEPRDELVAQVAQVAQVARVAREIAGTHQAAN